MIINQYCYSQINLRDIYGNELPPPSWPPPDSLYEESSFTIWFNESVINHDYLCDYWLHYGQNNKIKSNEDKILGDPVKGCFDIDTNLIKSDTLVNILHDLGAVVMCQYSSFSPCTDTLLFTRWGDTIRTPHFWNCFLIKLDTNTAVGAVQLLNFMFGGKKIDYAELNAKRNLDSPDDQFFILNQQTNFSNNIWASNITGAWEFTHGQRNVFLAVIDDGVNYMLTEFGGGIGNWPMMSFYRFVGGREYALFNDNNGSQPPTNGGAHGTQVSGQICAITNNENSIASIAGGWTEYEGTSCFNMKCRFDENGIYNISNAIIDAAANTNGGQGFAVNIINCSFGGDLYSETEHRAIDYAYRLGVTCFASKGNRVGRYLHYPADFDYNKIMAVGSHKARMRFGYPDVWIPSLGGGNWGYGIDILANGTIENIQTPLKYTTLEEDGSPFSPLGTATSYAAPQVSATASLLYDRYYISTAELDEPAYPEDIYGLLNISAEDCKYSWALGYSDTAGFDEKTGYGVLNAGRALSYIEPPYSLRHYSSEGGIFEPNSATNIENFIVIAPIDGSSSTLEPTSYPWTFYRATRYKVKKIIPFEDTWIMGRSWGIGSGSTGWDGTFPVEFTGMTENYQTQTGYTRVIGNGNPFDLSINHNNIRDIAYLDLNYQMVELETFCYQVWKHSFWDWYGGEYMGWYPCEPENVQYRFSIWGIEGILESVQNESKNYGEINFSVIPQIIKNKKINIFFHSNISDNIIINLFDALGNPVSSVLYNEASFNNANHFSISGDKLTPGLYFMIISSNGKVGKSKFIIIN